MEGVTPKESGPGTGDIYPILRCAYCIDYGHEVSFSGYKIFKMMIKTFIEYI